MDDILTAKLVAFARQLRAEGKPIPKHLQDHLDAVGVRESGIAQMRVQLIEPGRQEFISALFILGASLSQLGQLFGVRPQTISSYVKKKLSLQQRQAARSSGIWRPLISNERASEYYNYYQIHKRDLIGLAPIALAKVINAQVDRADVIPTDPNLDEIE